MSKMELHKKTLNLRRGDWEYLEEQYAPRGLQVSTIIRHLISCRVDALRGR